MYLPAFIILVTITLYCSSLYYFGVDSVVRLYQFTPASIFTLLGFSITVLTIRDKNRLDVDKLMRDENAALLSDKEAFKIIYLIDREGVSESFLNDEDIQRKTKEFLAHEKDFDRLFLMMNRIAFLDERESQFNAEYFQYYFEMIAESELCKWYLSYGTFDTKTPGITDSFERLFENLKQYLAKDLKTPVKWEDQLQRHSSDPLFRKFKQAYSQHESEKKNTQ